MPSLKYLFFIFFLVSKLSFGQNTTGINNTTPNKKAALDIKGVNQGILIPRKGVSVEADLDAFMAGVNDKGLTFYDTIGSQFYFWNGTAWATFGNAGTGANGVWLKNGNSMAASDTGAANFAYLGTSNFMPLILATDGTQRMRISREGNVGIGISQPLFTLHVDGSTSTAARISNLKQFDNGIGLHVISSNSASNNRMGGVFEASGGLIDNYGISTIATGGASSKGVSAYGNMGTRENYGLYGVAEGGRRAYGIYATASGATDKNVAGHFDGDVYFSSNQEVQGSIGIGTANPAAKLHIVSTTGALRIEDGTQGENKILVSDAGGNASWKTRNIGFNAVLWVSQPLTTNDQTIINFTNLEVNDGNAFDLATDRFVAPVNGLYQFGWSVTFAEVNANVGIYAPLFLNGMIINYCIDNATSDFYEVIRSTATLKLVAGDVVALGAFSNVANGRVAMGTGYTYFYGHLVY